MPTIATKFKIDGEKEYKQAISSINSDMRVLNSEMKLTSERYAENSSSTEALTEKGRVLEKQIQAQKEKVSELEQALQHAASATDADKASVNKWETSLNNAKAELVKLERQQTENNKALDTSTQKTEEQTTAQDNASTSGKGLGDVIGKLSSKIGITLPSDMTKGMNSLGNINTSLLTAALGAAAFATALVKVTKAVSDMTLEQAEAADVITTQSNVTGVDIETLQELNYAQELVDVSTTTITDSMAKNIRAMDDARNGNEELAKAYKELHVKITDGNGRLRDSEDVYWDVVDALGNVKNETERDALAMTLLGRSAQDLNPLIKIGSDGMKEYAQMARDAGAVDEERNQTLQILDDKVRVFNNNLGVTKDTIAASLAPALGDFIDTANDLRDILTEIVKETGLDDFLSSVLQSSRALLTTLGPIMEILGPIVAETLKPIALALGLVADTLSIIISSLGIVIESIKWLVGQSSGEAAAQRIYAYGDNISKVFSSQGATATALKLYGIGNNAEGTDYWRGGPTWVGEEGPEIINLPRGTQITPNKAIGGTNNYYLSVNARDLNTVARIGATFERARQEGRAR